MSATTAIRQRELSAPAHGAGMSLVVATNGTELSNRPRTVREIVLIVTLFLVYRQVRYLTRNDTAAAVSNAHGVVRLERRLGMFSERTLQGIVMHSHTVVTFLNRYYVLVHFPISLLFVVWVLTRHPEWYRPIRTWFVLVTAAALAIHVAFPLAPPRMLSGEGFVDTLQRFGPRIYTTDTNRSMANQFAAMPSLHFGWALMVALGFVAIKRTRRSLLAFAHPALTLLAIVATANHYWLDAAVAGLLVAVVAVAISARRPHEPPHFIRNNPTDHGDRSHPKEKSHEHHDHHDQPLCPDPADRPSGDRGDRRPDPALAGALR
jgi:PAP2 superfamily